MHSVPTSRNALDIGIDTRNGNYNRRQQVVREWSIGKLRLKSAEDYLSDLAGNKEKEELMSYKQTFLLVMQNLLAYRYRTRAPERLAHGMCQLCKISENDKAVAEKRRAKEEVKEAKNASSSAEDH